MIELTIDNSVCKISGTTLSQFKELRKLLSYSINSRTAYFSGAYNTTRYLLDKRGEFPTGLLYLVESHLKKNNVNAKIKDLRKRPKARKGLFSMSLLYLPYPEQLEAAKAVTVSSRGIITAPTGTGKSLIVALIINELQVPTLVVVPSLELKRQLTDSLRSVFGNTPNIRVQNIDSVKAEDCKGIDCVIIDEFHHSAAKTYRSLNKRAWRSIYYKVGLTATPFRSRNEERLLLESVLSKVIYRVNHKDAVEKGYIVPIEAFYVELPKIEPKGNEMNWASMYSELVVHNEYRNRLIAHMIKSLDAVQISSLCLVKEIAHGNIISDLSGIPFANGLEGNTPELISQFNNRDINCLIGTTGVLGEGVDTRPTEYVIIAGLGKSKNAFMQQVGRGFRKYKGKESCKIIIFKDSSHKWTLQHFKDQVKYLKEEYGVKPMKLIGPEGFV